RRHATIPSPRALPATQPGPQIHRQDDRPGRDVDRGGADAKKPAERGAVQQFLDPLGGDRVGDRLVAHSSSPPASAAPAASAASSPSTAGLLDLGPAVLGEEAEEHTSELQSR